jgi:predicted DNA-binding protein
MNKNIKENLASEIHIRISSDLENQLKELAKSNGLRCSSVARRILNNHFQECKEQNITLSI